MEAVKLKKFTIKKSYPICGKALLTYDSTRPEWVGFSAWFLGDYVVIEKEGSQGVIPLSNVAVMEPEKRLPAPWDKPAKKNG